MGVREVDGWLPTYLRDHYAGAVSGTRLFGRVADGHSEEWVRVEVTRLRDEVSQDRTALQSCMAALEVRQESVTMLVGIVGEYVGRLKPNGSLLRRSAGSDVLELEALSAAVQAKSRVWESLLVLARHDDRLDADQLQALLDRAHAQRDRLIDLHSRLLDTLIAG